MLKLIIFHLDSFINIDFYLQVSQNVENEYSSAFTEGGVMKGKLKTVKSKKIKNNDLSKGIVSVNVNIHCLCSIFY